MAKRRGYHTVVLTLGTKKKKKQLKLYTSQRVKSAADELLQDMNVYKFARLTQVLDAVYEHGKKEGSRHVFDALEKVKSTIPHRLPGRPHLS